MSVWDWVHKVQSDALAANDQQHLALTRLHVEAYNMRDSNPDQALSLLQQGHDIACQLNEPWWALFYDHWHILTLLYAKRDYSGALDIAIRAAVESRKPIYRELPQRICLHEDLIHAYIGIDPIGYATLIQEAIDYMETEITPTLECRFCLQGIRCSFAEASDRWQDAETEAARFHAMADESQDTHYRANACSYLCTLAYRRDDWAALLELAALGYDLAQRQGKSLLCASFLAWQALALRKNGDESAARRMVHSVYLRMSKLDPSNMPYYALTAYHEANGDYEEALALQDAALAGFTGKKLASECQCQLHRCQLKARMGKPITDDIAAAQALATKLIDPSVFLAKLARIERGDLSEKF